MATTSPTEARLVPLEEVELDTIPRVFFAGVDQHGEHPGMLFNDGTGWHPISRREVELRVEHLAAELRAIGIGAGERVAILSENRPEWAIADYAVLALGGADVPLYATLPPDQIAYILRDSEASAIFVSTKDQLAKILAIRSETPALKTIIAFDDPDGADGVLPLAEVERRGVARLESGEFPGLRALSTNVSRDDLATLIYTSGTTGDPKGVMLSHFNIASNIAASRQHNALPVEPGYVALSFLPLSHSFQRATDYFYWCSGVTIAYVDAVDKLAAAMVDVRPHVLTAAPRVFEKIYARVTGATGFRAKLIAWAQRVAEPSVDDRLAGVQHAPVGFRQKLADRLVFSKLRARTGGRLQTFVSGSAPLSADIAKFFWAAGLPIFEGYGLTESSPVLTANRSRYARLGSVGPPIPGTEIRIGPDGEILARGPQIMKGYFGKPVESSETVDSEGWLHTGDVGYLDDEGFLWITDRIKNIIVTAGGKNIAPAPIENVAALSPFVSQVVMIGDRRRFPALLVVPDHDYTRGWAKERGIHDGGLAALVEDPRIREAIERDVLERLGRFAAYERPKKVLLIPKEFTVDSGEITPTLKVKRRVVEENYREAIERMYAEA